MSECNKIQSKIRKKVNKNVECREFRESILLEGEVDSWQQLIMAGKIAAKSEYIGVINKIKVKGLVLPKVRTPYIKDKLLDGKKVDVLVIGGGVIGVAIIRYLSKWNISILLVDKESDLAMHQSSRNDSMIHPGIVPKPGSLKAKFNVRGNALFEDLAKELDVEFRRVGSYILFDKSYMKLAKPIFLNRAEKNGVKGVKYLTRAQIIKREPNIADEIVSGIYIPSTGICPSYKMTVALAENAVNNGAEVCLNTIVTGMEKVKNKITKVKTNRGCIYPKVVINAAGVFSDEIATMADDQFFTIHPRKGQIALLDKNKSNIMDCVLGVINLKSIKKDTKGGGLVKTAEGNILVGPSAYEQPYKEDYSTDKKGMDEVLNKNLPYVKGITKSDVITYLAGTRAATYKEKFIVENSKYVVNLIHAAGIQSPGYASSPAIAEEIEKLTIEMLKKIIKVELKQNWNPKRIGIPRLNQMTDEERNKYIQKRKDYGKIICRCEEISKGEVIDAIRSPIPALTVDAIKRRTRATMGRCQGGFCTPLIIKIIEQETHINILDIEKKGHGSYMLYKATKDWLKN